MKNTSFCATLAALEETQKKGPRRSKFDSMTRNSIDGKVIKSDIKKLEAELATKETTRRTSVSKGQDSDNESEEGSQYNIFGSKQVVLNQELRENLGLVGSDSNVDEVKEPKVVKDKPARGVSILKKSSVVVKIDRKSVV